MSFENVDILLSDTAPENNPLEGVVAKILSEDGRLVYGQVSSSAQGVVRLLLPAPQVYQVRFYKFGVSFSGAVLIDVREGEENIFTVKGEKYSYPQSSDPRICIASGFFRRPSGGIAPGVDMHFIGKFDPLLLEGAAILPERVIARTDQRGYVEVPLIRFAQYDVTLQGMEDYQRAISVPDAPSVNIGDLLFPVVTAVNFEETGPYSVAKGADLTLTPHVFTSDLRELEDITSDLLWSTSNSSGLGLNPQKSSITFRGIEPGTYAVNAVRRDQSIVRIPNTPIIGVPIQIVVTA